jgi:uncharacterized protein YbbK (DUF523 family)/uncharacterized protein YbgA (DUF1722 family)
LGNNVRYDGGNKRNDFILEKLSPYFNLISVCPECASGMGSPRESIKIFKIDGKEHLISPSNNVDHTSSMESWCNKKINKLSERLLHGGILKSKSPSCGVSSIKIFDPTNNEILDSNGKGIFARKLIETFPHLPVISEKMLLDPQELNSFILKAMFTKYFKENCAAPISLLSICEFHSKIKYFLKSISPEKLNSVDAIINSKKHPEMVEMASSYLMACFSLLDAPRNVKNSSKFLSYVANYFASDKSRYQNIVEKIEYFSKNAEGYFEIIDELRDMAINDDNEYLLSQYVLQPSELERDLLSII